MNTDEMLKKAASASFRKANGAVLRTINILREKYNKLDVVQSILEESGVETGEFVDALNFLSMCGYIQLRDIVSKELADIADASYKDCEAKVTAKGIRLLAGGISDNMVEV